MKIHSCLFSLLFLIAFIACTPKENPNSNLLYKSSNNRLAAEWEPAAGVMFTWPLHIPHKLVIELSSDTRAYVLCPTEEEVNNAKNWFDKWEINLDKVRFLIIPQDVDASWVRDWGPHAIFQNQVGMSLGDGEYIYSTPITGLKCDDNLRFIFRDDKGEIAYTETEDIAPHFISEQLNIPLLELPFTFTGGNVLTDGNGTVFSTCVISNENEYDGMTQSDFLNAANDLAGAQNYHLISNFEHRGIQHIDCFMKVLDEHRLFVARPPKDHDLHLIYDRIVNEELSKLTNIYGDHYKILRLDTKRFNGDELTAYTNSLILNKTIYVPLFGIDQDSIALKQWREAMPGYEVKGFEFIIDEEPVLAKLAYDLYDEIGWRGGDALHCRTRAVWDADMLFINVRYSHRGEKVVAKILDYSQRGLAFKPKLVWREKNSKEWKFLGMVEEETNHYSSSFPENVQGEIEYYVSAISKSGKEENNPRTAPDHLHSHTID